MPTAGVTVSEPPVGCDQNIRSSSVSAFVVVTDGDVSVVPLVARPALVNTSTGVVASPPE